MLSRSEQPDADGIPEAPVDLPYYWQFLRRHLWLIIRVALGVVMLTGAIVFVMAPVYRSTVTVLIEMQGNRVIAIDPVAAFEGDFSEFHLTQYKILQTRRLLEQTVRELDLQRHPEFTQRTLVPSRVRDRLQAIMNADPVPPAEARRVDEAVAQLRSGLTVRPLRGTQLVRVSFEARDAELAAAVPRTLVARYIEDQVAIRSHASRRAGSWLATRAGALRGKLVESEQQLQAFREREHILGLEGDPVVVRELTEITRRLAVARIRLTEARNIYLDTLHLQGRPALELLAVPAVLQHPLIHDAARRHANASRQKAEYRGRYGPKHPKMMALQAELSSTADDLEAQVAGVVAGLERDYHNAESAVRDLELQLENTRSAIREGNRNLSRLQVLQRNVAANRNLYELFLTRIKETGEAAALDSVQVRVIDPAVVSRSPVSPRRGVALGLAAVFGLILGWLVALIRDRFDNTLRSGEQVEEQLGVPLLAEIPEAEGSKAGSQLAYWLDQQTPCAESIRSLRTVLKLSGSALSGQPVSVTLVCSSLPGEGKSTICLNLAAALGQAGSVLVVGADLRRPALAQRTGLSPQAPGLAQWVAGSCELDGCIHRWDAGGVDILPAGIIPPNPLEVLGSARISQAFQVLAQRYTHIVIDSAPVHAVSDVMLLARHADHVVYVVRSTRTSVALARQGIAGLVDAGFAVTGVVLNRVNPKTLTEYAHDPSREGALVHG